LRSRAPKGQSWRRTSSRRETTFITCKKQRFPFSYAGIECGGPLRIDDMRWHIGRSSPIYLPRNFGS
jgi:hypothetical protein